jgi:type II secretion system protein G
MHPSTSASHTAHLGFTLIELLIVVAIIAILAAIAVPNFLEAQTRSKVSRVQADMRSIATALEAYRVDTNRYPEAAPNSVFLPFGERLVPLTTPVSYMTNVPMDIFRFKKRPQDPAFDYLDWETTHIFAFLGPIWNPFPGYMSENKRGWHLDSVGPDQVEALTIAGSALTYDPTNGTISEGDIHRYGP